jgi:putative transposase
MVGPAAKREAVAHLRNVLQMSERRACILVAADRKIRALPPRAFVHYRQID